MFTFSLASMYAVVVWWRGGEVREEARERGEVRAMYAVVV
jgi:hypothetical protein